MRYVRRASLVVSLTLIVVIAMGYWARQSELADARDARLTSSVEVGAARLESMIDSVTVAAASGADSAAVGDAVAALDDRFGVCAVDPVQVACTGGGPFPSMELVGQHQLAMRADEVFVRPTLTVHGSDVTIDIGRSDLAVIVRAPLEVLDSGSGLATWVTTDPPSVPGAFVVTDGSRSTVAQVGELDTYVVAAGPDRVIVPDHERRIGVIVFAHAVALLALAAYATFADRRRLVERATIDSVTKLPNRSEFERLTEELLDTAERQEIGVCLLLFDLNGFKQVNDTYGHQAGDELLEVVGTRLRAAVRRSDIVARWGGDEFVVVMPGIRDVDKGERRARQIVRRVKDDARLRGSGRVVSVSASVGVALWPYHGRSIRDLVAVADEAMYFAKRHGVPVAAARPRGAADRDPLSV